MFDNQNVESPNFINLGVVVNDSGEVLMVRRVKEEKGKDGSRLVWAFPGGKQKEEETRQQCVEREVLAETGYEVSYLKQVSLRVPPDLPIIIVYHLCRLVNSKQKQPNQPWEIAEVRWVKLQDIKSLITTSLDPQVAKELNIT